MLNGEIIEVEFRVDDLMKRNEPYTNFWRCCIVNGYLNPRKDGSGWDSAIDRVWLELSENEEHNEIIREMLDKYDIFVHPLDNYTVTMWYYDERKRWLL